MGGVREARYGAQRKGNAGIAQGSSHAGSNKVLKEARVLTSDDNHLCTIHGHAVAADGELHCGLAARQHDRQARGGVHRGLDCQRHVEGVVLWGR